MFNHPIFRWIVFFPAAVLSAAVAQALVKFVQIWQIGDGPLARISVEVFSGLTLGSVFVLVATQLAPTHKHQVAMAMFAVVAILFGCVMTAALLMGNKIWVYVNGAAMLVGAAAAAYPEITKQQDLEAP